MSGPLKGMALVMGLALQVFVLVAGGGEFTYQNPIEGGPSWIRDPFIIRVGDAYFMTGTYKEPGRDGPAAWPGFKLWSSDDLLQWKEEGFLLRNEDIRWGDERFWAPEIRLHPRRRKYYLTYNVQWSGTGRQGSGLAVADDVRGPYRNLTPDAPLAQSNDASLFFDDDGRAYLLQSSITICEVDLDRVKIVGSKKRLLVPAEEGAWDSRIIEGPNMVKINGTYYLFWSATGWGYTVGYATAGDVWGPYVKHPKNPIYGAARPECESELREPPDCPFDEVGHGSLFTGPDGRWWLSSHGYGYEPGPFREPRLCIDPLDFDPATGQFWAKLTWTLQTIRISAAAKPRLADMGSEPDEERP
jgi:xylan 1,4-beta-xylosidase